jgi:3',5'-cyclic AMP phosphodiesterase CpdA
MEWVRALSPSAFQHDAVILAGDISDQMAVLEETFRYFTAKFKHVFFTPGNHDLWAGAYTRPLFSST